MHSHTGTNRYSCVPNVSTHMVILLARVHITQYVEGTRIHTHTNTTKGVNSGDFPCQLLSRHWFKETSICDVSTYLMNPLRSMEALVCYTVRLHCLACFYVYCDSFGIHVGLGQNMSRCVCVCVCDRACMMLYNWKKSLLINHLFFECICILN